MRQFSPEETKIRVRKKDRFGDKKDGLLIRESKGMVMKIDGDHYGG